MSDGAGAERGSINLRFEWIITDRKSTSNPSRSHRENVGNFYISTCLNKPKHIPLIFNGFLKICLSRIETGQCLSEYLTNIATIDTRDRIGAQPKAIDIFGFI